MISSTEMKALRADVTRLTLLDTCRIWAQAETVQATGEVVRSYTVKASAVPCRLDPVQVSPDEGRAGRTGIEDEYQLSLPWDVSIEASDRIEIGGVRYAINSLHERHSLRAVTRARVRTERLP
jgi:hypothetical protein